MPGRVLAAVFQFLGMIFLISLNYQAIAQANSDQEVSGRVRVGTVVFSTKDTIINGVDTNIVRKNIVLYEKDTMMTLFDLVIVGQDSLLISRDTMITKIDTIVTAVDTVRSYNEIVFTEIREFSERKNIFSRLLKNILVFDKKENIPIPQAPTQSSDQVFDPYKDKTIRNIKIVAYNAFGYSVRDPGKKPVSFIEKAGNAVHIKTHRYLIRNRLLFSEGDKVSTVEIAETERLLRQTNFIYDANIVIKEIENSPDSVDIVVYTQDVWSINGGASGDPARNSYDFDIRDVNFIGLGHQFENKLRLSESVPKGYNFLSSYNISNIYKTFIGANFLYGYEYGLKRYGFGLNRDFISPAIKWAGGYNMYWYEYSPSVQINDSVSIISYAKYFQQDIWLGYSLSSLFKWQSERNRWIASGRLVRTRYQDKPSFAQAENYFYNSDFYLFSIGHIYRRFYKDSYIFRLGRTEDITEGNMIAFTSGIEYTPRGPRQYVGLSAAYSKYNSRYGYLFTNLQVGTFIYNKTWQEGVITFKSLYFTPIINLSRWKWRQYLSVRFTNGLNQKEGALVNINKDNGIRGINSPALSGRHKLVLNYETNIFPPFNILGFRMGLVFFTDLGWVSTRPVLITKSSFFPAYGVGFRIKNEHLVFNTIQVLLGYYPKAHLLGMQNWQLFERSGFFYKFNDFQYSRPSVIPFD
ncbi:MAG TPA: hypothetical protein VIK89_08685 [Cytophagaceae bacterium]